jgi:hypothetical protein
MGRIAPFLSARRGTLRATPPMGWNLPWPFSFSAPRLHGDLFQSIPSHQFQRIHLFENLLRD